MTFKEKLLAVQTALKAPKDQYNDFGKYKYRSCESILEAVKPLLASNKLLLNMTDDIVAAGDRIYVKATATLLDAEDTNDNIQTTAFAREPLDKKGMDDSQVTGTASSYARKYALNAMFLIDDTKDADTNEYREMTANSKPQKAKKEEAKDEPKPDTTATVRANAIMEIREKLLDDDIPEEWICSFYGQKALEKLKDSNLKTINKRFKDFRDKYIEMNEFEKQQAASRSEDEYYDNIVDMMGVER